MFAVTWGYKISKFRTIEPSDNFNWHKGLKKRLRRVDDFFPYLNMGETQWKVYYAAKDLGGCIENSPKTKNNFSDQTAAVTAVLFELHGQQNQHQQGQKQRQQQQHQQ